MPNKKTKKQLIVEGKSAQEINKYFGINNKTGRQTKWTEKDSLGFAKDLWDWMMKDNKNLFFQEFCAQKKVHPQIINELSHKHESFSEAIKEIKYLQEARLMRYGLSNPKASSMCIFMLRCNHGYKEQEKQDAHKLKERELELKENEGSGGIKDLAAQWVRRLRVGTKKDLKDLQSGKDV